MVRLTHFIQQPFCNVKFFRNPISAIDIHRSNFQMWSWWSLSLRHDPPPGKQPDAASSDSLCGSLRPYGHQHSTPSFGSETRNFQLFFHTAKRDCSRIVSTSRHRAALIVRFTIEVENLQRGSILQGLVRTDLYAFAWLYNAMHITYTYIYIHIIFILRIVVYIYIYSCFSCTLYIYVYIYVHIYIYTHMCSLKTASFKRPVNPVSSW